MTKEEEEEKKKKSYVKERQSIIMEKVENFS